MGGRLVEILENEWDLSSDKGRGGFIQFAYSISQCLKNDIPKIEKGGIKFEIYLGTKETGLRSEKGVDSRELNVSCGSPAIIYYDIKDPVDIETLGKSLEEFRKYCHAVAEVARIHEEKDYDGLLAFFRKGENNPAYGAENADKIRDSLLDAAEEGKVYFAVILGTCQSKDSKG